MSAPIVARHMQLQFYIHITPTGHAPKLHALTIIAYFAYKLLAAPPPQTKDLHLGKGFELCSSWNWRNRAYSINLW